MPQSQQQKTVNWVPYMGLAITVAGIIFQSGVLTSRVNNNTDRLGRVEAQQAATTKTISDMDIRGARNEEKLDFLVQQALERSSGKGK